MSDGGFATVNENLRQQQVYATLVNFGGAEMVDRIGLSRDDAARAALDLPGARADPSAVADGEARIMLESLGPTYVKLGQIISSQASALPDDWRVQLDLLQNEVPPVPYELARQVIIAELARRRRSCTRPSPRGPRVRPRRHLTTSRDCCPGAASSRKAG